jgi:crotonobetainyl-CoA hydratase
VSATSDPGAASDPGRVDVELVGSVARVSLQRPASLNALTPAMVGQLRRAFASIDRNPAITGAVLCGGSSTSFCAGADLGSSLVDDDLEPLADGPYLTVKPLVAAVRGWAVGVGMKLVCTADLVVASDDATLWSPETRVGILGMGDIGHRLVRQLPYRVAMAMLLAGERLRAARAFDLGFVNALASSAAVDALALELAGTVTVIEGLSAARGVMGAGLCVMSRVVNSTVDTLRQTRLPS